MDTAARALGSEGMKTTPTAADAGVHSAPDKDGARVTSEKQSVN